MSLLLVYINIGVIYMGKNLTSDEMLTAVLSYLGILVIIPLIIAVVILLDHLIIHGYFIDLDDINNHETLALFFLGISLGAYLGGWKKK